MTPGMPRLRMLVAFVLVVSGLVVVGRLAVDAWLLRPLPAELRIVQRMPTGRPSPLFIGIVDGLRAEAVVETIDGVATMPFWQAMVREGVGGIGVTGEPTMTACCVRTILTGRNPDLYTAFANFDAREIGGSVTEFLVARGLRAAHAGDAAAWQLTRRWYAKADVLAFPDRGPRDQGGTDDASLPFALEKAQDPDVAVLTYHVVRPDHAGHKHGATGAEYRAACTIADDHLRQVVGAFRARRPGATVLLTADHGVTPRGTHGGGEPGARRAPFVLVGPRVVARAGVELPQSSLAPTLCALLDLPMPPLAETPPALELTRLSPVERVDALDAYVRARMSVAEALGAGEAVAAADARRRAAFVEGPNAALGRLVEVSQELEREMAGRSGPIPAALTVLLAVAWLVALVRAAGPAPRRGTWLVALPIASWLCALAAGGWLGHAAASPLGGTLAIALAALAWAWDAQPAVGGTRTLTIGGLLAVPVVGAAGLLLQHAFDATEDAGPAASRTLVVGAVVVVGAIALLVRAGARAAVARVFDARPALLVALLAGALGFTLSLRLFLDPFVHTPILFAAVAGVAVVVGAVRAGRRTAPAHAAAVMGVVAVAMVLFGGGRVAEGLAPDWILSPAAVGAGWKLACALLVVGGAVALVRTGAVPRTPRERALVALAGLTVVAAASLRFPGVVAPALAYQVARASGVGALLAATLLRTTPDVAFAVRLVACAGLAALYHERSDAQLLVFLVVEVGAGFASRLAMPSTRGGLALLAVVVVAVRIALFHAAGYLESFSTIDVGAGVVPGQASGGPVAGAGWTVEMVENIANQLLKFALTWIVLLAAIRRSLERDGAADGLRVLGVDLSIAFAARGTLLAIGMLVWWRSSWWVAVAYPVFVLGAIDVVLVLVALTLVGALGSPRAGARGAEPRPVAA